LPPDAPVPAGGAGDDGLDPADLPFNQAVLGLIRAAQGGGRRIYLVSRADPCALRGIADHLKLFDGVFAVERGAGRARILADAFGERGFDYVGHSPRDLPVWAVSATAYLVEAAPAVVAGAAQAGATVTNLGTRGSIWPGLFRGLRPQQWLKNLLIFVPGLAAHVGAAAAYGHAAIAFLSFSLCASSVYVLNDLIDLPHDRRHDTKRRRPLAAGLVPVRLAAAAAAALLVAALALAALVSAEFLTVLAGYYLVTLAYSLALRRMLVLDVITLACLYGVRVVAGGVAFGVPLSEWLVSFSLFLFLSLALVKRAAELSGGQHAGERRQNGRAYRSGDLPILQTMATAAGFVALLVLALYISSTAVTQYYTAPKMLWGIDVVLAYWLCRVLVLTQRGEMREDPVAFAATDGVSLGCGALIGAIAVGASL
jgi:4-hydroxybenzoate polyprenyltransferase